MTRKGLGPAAPWGSTLRRRWEAFWFPERRELSLAVCRIAAVSAQLFVFLPSLGANVELASTRGGFMEPQWLIRGILAVIPEALFLRPETFAAIHWTTAFAGVLCLVGLFTRLSALVFALGNWVFIAHGYSYGEEHHPEAILCIFLLLLAFGPSGRRLSLDGWIAALRSRPSPGDPSMAGWPLRLTQALLALAYFSTGLAKVVYGGLQWMNGYTLQRYLFGSAVPGLPVGEWLAQQHDLAVLLSVATLLFELSFFVVLFIPRLVPLFVIGGTALHVGIHYAMGATFWSHILLYLTFVDFDGLAERVKSWRARRSAGSRYAVPSAPYA